MSVGNIKYFYPEEALYTEKEYSGGENNPRPNKT